MFPGLKTQDVFTSLFKKSATTFINPMLEAFINVKISAPLRSPQRALLKHFSFLIAKGLQELNTIPAKENII
jgi:hypothetical protein